MLTCVLNDGGRRPSASTITANTCGRVVGGLHDWRGRGGLPERCSGPYFQLGTEVGTARAFPTLLAHLTHGFKPFP